MLTAASSIVPELFKAITMMRDCVALTVPSVEPLEITKLEGVPETEVTVPLPRVVERKSSESADAEIVKALDATDAEIGCIWGIAPEAINPPATCVNAMSVPYS
jgi:hypothetical protein